MRAPAVKPEVDLYYVSISGWILSSNWQNRRKYNLSINNFHLHSHGFVVFLHSAQVPVCGVICTNKNSLLTVACNLAAWCHRSSTCAYLLQVLTFSPGEVFGHTLQPTVYAEVFVRTLMYILKYSNKISFLMLPICLQSTVQRHREYTDCLWDILVYLATHKHPGCTFAWGIPRFLWVFFGQHELKCSISSHGCGL